MSFDLLYSPTFGEYYRLPRLGVGGRSGTVIVSPNNPTTHRADLPLIKKALEQRDVVILDLSLNADSDKPYLGLLKQYKNLVVIKSLGKVMGIPGLRLGYVALRDDLIPDFESHLPIWNVNAFAERFFELHLDCLSDFESSLRSCRAASSELGSALAKLFPNDSVAHSDLFVYWITDHPIHAELYRRGFFIADLSHKFGSKGDSRYHYRIGIRSEEENQSLIEAMRSIQKSGLSAPAGLGERLPIQDPNL